MPNWNVGNQPLPEREEKRRSHLAIGQVGSSTRQEITSWLVALTLLIRQEYKTDSFSTEQKADLLTQRAEEMARREQEGERVN